MNREARGVPQYYGITVANIGSHDDDLRLAAEFGIAATHTALARGTQGITRGVSGAVDAGLFG